MLSSLSNTTFGQDSRRRDDTITITTSYSGEQKATDIYLEAVKLLSIDGDREGAYALFEKVLEEMPSHAPSLYYKASMTPDIAEASRLSERAIALDSTNIEYKTLYADLLIRSNRVDEAIEVWKGIVEKENKNLNRHLQMASLYMSMSKPYDAMNTLDKASELFGVQPEILSYQQDIYTRLRLTDKAIVVGEKLVEMYPDNTQPRIALARSYISTAQDSLAWEQAERAYAIDSTDINVQLLKADLYQSKGQTADYLNALSIVFANQELEAESKIRFFEGTLERADYYRNNLPQIEKIVNSIRMAHPDSYDADVLYARHLVNLGEVKKALNVYKGHINDSINQRDALKNVLGIETFLKESRDSIAKYNNIIIERFPLDIDMLLMSSSSYYAIGEYQNAVNIAEGAIKNAANDSIKSVLYGYAGDIYHEMGKSKNSYKSYDKALKYDKNNVNVLNNYSYFLSMEDKNLEKALTMSSQAIAAEPDNATYLDTYGWILYKLERYEEARKFIQRALALSTEESSTLYLHLGDVYLALGDKFSAKIYWDKALKSGATEEEVQNRTDKLD